MKFREIVLSSGTKLLLGKDASSNDELMKKFKGKTNIVLHTESPGSPFCVIQSLNPSKKDIKAAAAVCARYSRDWRDNKGNIKVSVFTGKGISKKKGMKSGTWHVDKSKIIKIKKRQIKKFE